jgi:hypothetical protein
MKNLKLAVKRRWFEDIQSGVKSEEFRLNNDYWKKRLEGKDFDKVIITLGYPSNDQIDRIMEFPWRGYEMKTIVSEEWDNVPQEVFAIKVIPNHFCTVATYEDDPDKCVVCGDKIL